MPKRKKKATEMTTDELERRLFPKKVVDEIRRVARESDERGDQSRKKRSS